MLRILFVCHGNICRSPMAQWVLQDMVDRAGLSYDVYIRSAAVSREELGNPIYPPARRELRRHGITPGEHQAHQITAQDCRLYDRIYYMDTANARYLYRMFPQETKFRPFLPYDVADPWYSGDFTQTWADICLGCEKILEELKNGL